MIATQPLQRALLRVKGRPYLRVGSNFKGNSRSRIEGWMRFEQLDSLTIIDLTAWSVAFRKRMATVFLTNPDAASSLQAALTEAGQSEVGFAI